MDMDFGGHVLKRGSWFVRLRAEDERQWQQLQQRATKAVEKCECAEPRRPFGEVLRSLQGMGIKMSLALTSSASAPPQPTAANNGQRRPLAVGGCGGAGCGGGCGGCSGGCSTGCHLEPSHHHLPSGES
jgi:hypothetical protein